MKRLTCKSHEKLPDTETKRAGHAAEIMEGINPAEYSGVIVVSGDGLLNEVVNGMLNRPDWQAVISRVRPTTKFVLSQPFGCHYAYDGSVSNGGSLSCLLESYPAALETVSL